MSKLERFLRSRFAASLAAVIIGFAVAAIGAGYRAVGWLSAVSLLALACRAVALLLCGEKG